MASWKAYRSLLWDPPRTGRREEQRRQMTDRYGLYKPEPEAPREHLWGIEGPWGWRVVGGRDSSEGHLEAPREGYIRSP